MKIVWVVPGFSGDERDWCIPALLNLARVLSRFCDLHIVALRYPYRRDTYSVFDAEVHSVGGGHHGPSHTPFIWLEAARLIRKLDGDVLHAIWAYEPGLITGWFGRRMPVVVSLAGGELAHLPDIQYGLAGKLRVRASIRWALRRARLVTAGSNSLCELGRSFLHTIRPELLPFGLDLSMWPFKMPRQPHSFLSVASLEPVKGHAVLLKAFRKVANNCPDARLRVVGSGRMEARLRRLTRELDLYDRIEFCGAIPHQELYATYASSSVFVQSSFFEAQCMAMLEAAACGLPVTGTAVGSLADLAPVAAISVPVGDSESLAEAALEMMLYRNRAAQLALRARQIVERDYSVEGTARRLVDLYGSLRK